MANIFMSESQKEYLEGLISEVCSSIYEWSKADTRLARAILAYYGYTDVDIHFVKPMFSGNRCLAIDIWIGDPECLYERIRIEY